MAKKIAVLVRDRKSEALRMAVGATLANDQVSVFVMDDKLEPDDGMLLSLETLADFNARVFSNNPDNKFEQKSMEEIAKALLEYDVIVPY